jgi:hypothetical protein
VNGVLPSTENRWGGGWAEGSRGRDFRGRGGEVGAVDVVGVGAATEIADEGRGG